VPRRALTTAFLAVALAATAFVLPGHPAQAIAADVPDTTSWVTNGDVHTVIHGNGRTYIGGTFDQVGPNTGFGVPLNASNGALPFESKVNGPVYAAVSDGAGGWYIGGNFTRVAGKSLHNAAYIKPDGTAGGWNPSPDLTVYAIALDANSGRVYIGGEFATVRRSSGDGSGDAYVPGLAATKRNDGGLDSTAVLPVIKPAVDAAGARHAVKTLALTADKSRLYFGGTFAAVCRSWSVGGGCANETARSGLAAANIGANPPYDTAWAPQPDGPVAAVALSGGTVFVGGAFTSIGGASRAGFAALSAYDTGSLSPAWEVQADGPVDSLALADSGASLYVGGSFTKVGKPAGWYDRAGLAKLILIVPGGIGGVDTNFQPEPDGAVLSIAPAPNGKVYAGGSFQAIGGANSRFLAALDPATGAADTAFNPMVAATVRTVIADASSPYVYAGGDFSSVGGVIRRNLAALVDDPQTGQMRLDPSFSADISGSEATPAEVNALLLSGNSLYVGGTFKNIAPYTNGKNRGLAKVDATTGAPDSGFVVKIDSTVMTLGSSGGHLYVGGNFNSVKDGTGFDSPRAKGASLNATTGAVELGWNPNPDKAIKDLLVSPDGSRVYIAGDFDTLGSASRTRLAAVDPTTGAPTDWKPAPPDSVIKMDLSPDGSTVFLALGGRYGVGNRTQAWRTTSNDRVWDVEGDGDFQAVAATPYLVYVGGHYNFLNKKAYERQHLTGLDPATGAVQPWGPLIGGVHGVLDLFVTDQYVYVAGEFDNIGNEGIQGIARFANLGDHPPVLPPTQPPVTTPTTPPGNGGNNPPVGPASTKVGYWMVGADGAVYSFGDAAHFGGATPAAGSTAVDLEPTPSGAGYWIVTDKGVITTRGDAGFFGAPSAASLTSGETVTSLSATPTGRGYWVFTSKGRVMNFGDAVHYGDVSKVTLNGPVLDSIPTTSGRGYYMVASDGGIFAFGDAVFHGSMGGTKLNKPVQSLVPDGDGEGYWLVASDGGIFAFKADFRGSLGGVKLNKPVTGMVRYADGYMMVGEDGGIFNFSTKPFLGSLGANPPARPIVSVAALG
jgi:hypothetical protein